MIGTWTTFEDLKIICWLPVLFSSVHRCTRPFKALQEASLFSEDVFSIRVFTYVLQTNLIQYIAYETYISNLVLHTYMCILVHTLFYSAGWKPITLLTVHPTPNSSDRRNGAQPTLRALLKGSAVRMTPTECSQVRFPGFPGGVRRRRAAWDWSDFLEWRCWLFWRR